MWRRPDGRALVATVDVFTPIVDDPATWGRIAAVNAVSDIYAMGARPLFALAIAAWPRSLLPLDMLSEVLAAGQAAADDDGWVVGGGHTVDGSEPWYGQAIVGEVAIEQMVTNAGALPGNRLILTKPLGTGVITTAVKAADAAAVAPGGDLAVAYKAAVASMSQSNRAAAEVLVSHGVTAMTDVTGFGLLGHLHSLALASGVAARIDLATVPMLPDVMRLIAEDKIPGGTRRNLADVTGSLDVRGVNDAGLVLLADAQTSGGLMGAVPAERASDAVETLRDQGMDAAVIGDVVDGGAGRLTVVAH